MDARDLTKLSNEIKDGKNILKNVQYLMSEISVLRRHAEYNLNLTRGVKNTLHKEANQIEVSLDFALDKFIRESTERE